LPHFCQEIGEHHIILVADSNTWPILGKAVETILKVNGFETKSVVFSSIEAMADAHHILQMLLACSVGDQPFIAIGSGTITDITRFVSHRTGGSFIVMPTAPSVHSFTSQVSPLIVQGMKTTTPAHSPIAIFAGVGILSSAPRSMISAGFGDMLGKNTAVADWKLGSL
jgi:glycerol-1-phosphate dehydrogenase [NAD(P)+]